MGQDQLSRILKHSRIALDANIFIYALNDDRRFTTATALLRKFVGTEHAVCTSAISITEVLVPLFQAHARSTIPTYLDFLTGEGRITIVHVDDGIALHAAALRSEFGLKTPDAIHRATALAFHAGIFVTADQDFSLRSIGTLEIEKLCSVRT